MKFTLPVFKEPSSALVLENAYMVLQNENRNYNHRPGVNAIGSGELQEFQPTVSIQATFEAYVDMDAFNGGKQPAARRNLSIVVSANATQAEIEGLFASKLGQE